MTTPRKRAPGGGRKRTGNERHTVSLPPDLWAHVDAQEGGNRSERLRLVVRRDAEAQERAELDRQIAELLPQLKAELAEIVGEHRAREVGE
jgi:hypothetical protein